MKKAEMEQYRWWKVQNTANGEKNSKTNMIHQQTWMKQTFFFSHESLGSEFITLSSDSSAHYQWPIIMRCLINEYKPEWDANIVFPSPLPRLRRHESPLLACHHTKSNWTWNSTGALVTDKCNINTVHVDMIVVVAVVDMAIQIHVTCRMVASMYVHVRLKSLR